MNGSDISTGDIVGNVGTNFWQFSPTTGWDLTHPSSPDSPYLGNRLTLATTVMPITLATEKTAIIVIDMQNYFLSAAMGKPPGGPGYQAEEVLVSTCFPAARKAGIQIIHVTWGISEEELRVLPPATFHSFGYKKTTRDPQGFDIKLPQPGEIREKKDFKEIGHDLGQVRFPDGTAIAAGRLLMRDQWNTALSPRMQQSFDESHKTIKPDTRFDKCRISGFWGGSTPVTEYLKDKGITTLLFTGVNTDQCVLASMQDASNLGFDTILLKDGCGTSSPDYARMMVEFNSQRWVGFVSSCEALAEGAKAML